MQDGHMETRHDIMLILELHGMATSEAWPSIPHTAAKRYAARHADVRYEWWTVKTGPGTAAVAWRLIKEKR